MQETVQEKNVGQRPDAARLEARATGGQGALIRPSAITSEGWYWAEEVVDDGDDYRLVVLRAESVLEGRDLRFELDGNTYDRAAADEFFRVIRRLDEPSGPVGGWARSQPCAVCHGSGRLMWGGWCPACDGAGMRRHG